MKCWHVFFSLASSRSRLVLIVTSIMMLLPGSWITQSATLTRTFNKRQLISYCTILFQKEKQFPFALGNDMMVAHLLWTSRLWNIVIYFCVSLCIPHDSGHRSAPFDDCSSSQAAAVRHIFQSSTATKSAASDFHNLSHNWIPPCLLLENPHRTTAAERCGLSADAVQHERGWARSFKWKQTWSSFGCWCL